MPTSRSLTISIVITVSIPLTLSACYYIAKYIRGRNKLKKRYSVIDDTSASKVETESSHALQTWTALGLEQPMVIAMVYTLSQIKIPYLTHTKCRLDCLHVESRTSSKWLLDIWHGMVSNVKISMLVRIVAKLVINPQVLISLILGTCFHQHFVLPRYACKLNILWCLAIKMLIKFGKKWLWLFKKICTNGYMSPV